jgi:hypothetical protein
MSKVNINNLLSDFKTKDIVDIFKYDILPYISYFDVIEQYELDKATREKILNDQTKIVENDGKIIYMVDGKKHREDGPAVITEYVKEWWYNDKLHRHIGPAVEYADGDREWYFNGLRHRESGPAVIYKGIKEWWRNGVRYREDGPHIITAIGELIWCRNDRVVSMDEYDNYYGPNRDHNADYHPDEFYYYDEEETIE